MRTTPILALLITLTLVSCGGKARKAETMPQATAARETGAENLAIKSLIKQLPYPGLPFQISIRTNFSELAITVTETSDTDKRLARADKILAKRPADPEALLERAQCLEIFGRKAALEYYALAETAWRARLEAEPDNPSARFRLAQALWALNKTEEALPIIRDLASEKPKLWWPHLALAWYETYTLWDLKIAFEDARLPQDSSSEAFRTWLAYARLAWPRLAGLEAEITEAIDNPRLFEELLQRLNDNAFAHIDDAHRASPNKVFPRVFKQLVALTPDTFEHGIHKLTEAVELFRELAQLHPHAARLQVLARWGQLYKWSIDKGVQDFSRIAYAVEPQDRERFLKEEQTVAKAVDEQRWDFAEAHILLATYRLIQRDFRGALSRLQLGIRTDPTSAESWEAYLTVLMATGDVDAVRAALVEALKHVQSGKFRCALAKAHIKLDDDDLAEQELLLAIEHRDGYMGMAQLMLGILRLKHGNVSAALAPLKTATMWTQDHLADTALALALALSDDMVAARYRIERAKKTAPSDTIVRQALDALDEHVPQTESDRAH